MDKRQLVTKKGINYYNNATEACLIAEHLRDKGYPEARVVFYELGYAVQYEKSGSYYPELEQ